MLRHFHTVATFLDPLYHKPPHFKKEFEEWEKSSRTLLIRVISVLTGLLYVLYSLIDQEILSGVVLGFATFLHLYFLPSFLLLIAAISYFKKLYQVIIFLTMTATIFAVLGNIYLIGLLHSSLPFYEEAYSIEIYLIIIWIFAISGLPFRYALPTAFASSLLNISYQIYFDTPDGLFYLHLLWMVSGFSFGLLSALIISKFYRQTFLNTKELKSLLTQRELLMQELNHRVKNNLQFIITLLWLKRAQSSPETQQALLSLQTQISAIATVHEALCSQPNISSLDGGHYLQTIIDALHELYPHVIFGIKFEPNIILSMERTITLGLVISELISNSVKHAFSLDGGNIEISLSTSENQITLNYSDIMTDFEENDFITFSHSQNSIGWSMISELVSQLQATSNADGKNLIITFAL